MVAPWIAESEPLHRCKRASLSDRKVCSLADPRPNPHQNPPLTLAPAQPNLPPARCEDRGEPLATPALRPVPASSHFLNGLAHD